MSTTVTGTLTKTARLSGSKYALGLTPPAAPSGLWAALFSDTTSPDTGTPTELTVTGYARIGPITLTDTAGTLPLVSTADIAWTGLGGGPLGQLCLLDAASGGAFLAFVVISQVLADGASVTVAAGQLQVS